MREFSDLRETEDRRGTESCKTSESPLITDTIFDQLIISPAQARELIATTTAQEAAISRDRRRP